MRKVVSTLNNTVVALLSGVEELGNAFRPIAACARIASESQEDKMMRESELRAQEFALEREERTCDLDIRRGELTLKRAKAQTRINALLEQAKHLKYSLTPADLASLEQQPGPASQTA